MAEAAEADDAEVEAGAVEAVVAHGAVDADAGAEERGGGLEAEGLGDEEGVAVVDDDDVGEAAVGGGAVAVGAGVSQGGFLAVALEALRAVLAVAAGADDAAHAGSVSGSQVPNLGSGFDHNADDLVPVARQRVPRRN